MLKLVLLFTVVPLVELYLLLQLGEHVGLWPTVGIVLGTGVIGGWLARREGLRVLRQWQGALARGQLPEEGVLGGLLVLVGGVLLVTPGVLTDVTGFLLLIPPTRRVVADQVMKVVKGRMDDGTLRVVSPGEGQGFGFGGDPSRPGGTVIDGVAEEVDRPTHASAGAGDERPSPTPPSPTPGE